MKGIVYEEGNRKQFIPISLSQGGIYDRAQV